MRIGLGLVALCAAAFFIAWRLGSGQAALTFASIGVVAGTSALLLLSRHWSQGLLLPQIIIGIFVVQGFWLLVNAVIGGPTIPLGMANPIDLVDFPLEATLPLLLVPIGVAMCAGLLRVLMPIARRDIEALKDQERLISFSPLFKFYLLSCAVLLVLYWPANLPQQGLGWAYFMRVLCDSLLLMSFLAGKHTVHDRPLSAIWYVALLSNMIVAALAGSRALAFVPPALFVAGRIFGTRGTRRRRWAIVSLLSAVPVFLVSGLIGLIRIDIGRGADLVTADRAEAVVKTGLQTIDSMQDSSRLSKSLKNESVGRMIVWPNYAVAIMTPSVVPFRSFEGMLGEAQAYLSIGALSGRTVEEFLSEGLGQYPATQYGFRVDEGTSVEFSMFADAWSRGGEWVCVVFGFVVGLILGGLERSILVLIPRWPSSAVVLRCVLASGSLALNTSPVLHTMRRIVLCGGFVLVLLIIGEGVARALGVRDKQRGAIRRAATHGRQHYISPSQS